MSDRNKAFKLQDYLVENGISEGSILNHIINNYLSGAEALDSLRSVKREFLDEEDVDEDYEDDNYDEYDDDDRFGEMI